MRRQKQSRNKPCNHKGRLFHTGAGRMVRALRKCPVPGTEKAWELG